MVVGILAAGLIAASGHAPRVVYGHKCVALPGSYVALYCPTSTWNNVWSIRSGDRHVRVVVVKQKHHGKKLKVKSVKVHKAQRKVHRHPAKWQMGSRCANGPKRGPCPPQLPQPQPPQPPQLPQRPHVLTKWYRIGDTAHYAKRPHAPAPSS